MPTKLATPGSYQVLLIVGDREGKSCEGTSTFNKQLFFAAGGLHLTFISII